jgi:iron complex outermembrane receptor protein
VTTFVLLAVLSADGGVTTLAPVDVPLPADETVEALPSSPLVRDPSATLTVRDARDARAEAKDASEVVGTSPGVVVQDSGGAGQRKTLSLRGAAPNAVLVLLDGVPLAGPGAAMDLSRIPTAALDRVEVMRGAGSPRYGPGAMGGVVNLVTRAPDGRTSLFADATQGSFVTTQLSAGGMTSLLGGDGLVLVHGLRSEGTFDFRYDAQPNVAGSALTTLPRTNNDALQGGGLVRFRRLFGATQLDVLGEGTVEGRGLAGPVQNPTPTARQQTGRGTLSLRTSTELSSGGTLSSLAAARLDDTTLSGSFLGAGEYRQLDGSVNGEVTYRHLLLGAHGLTALISGGADFLREPGGTNPAWGRFGVMVADEWLLLGGALTLNGSARVDVAGRFVVFSPKLGATVELPKGFFLKGNAGQASRPPSFAELYVVQGTMLPNAELRPERALTGDVGAGWKHEKAEVSATGFLALYEDLISYEYYPPNLARPYNFSAARVGGVEVEGVAKPFTWLEASAAYTWLDTQNLRDDPRYYLKSLPFRPRHRVHARVVAGPAWLKGRVELTYQSMQFTNRTETLALPERALLNVGLTATPWKSPKVTVSAELKNVLDVHTQDLDGYPLPPRAFFVTLGVQWDEQKSSPQRLASLTEGNP